MKIAIRTPGQKRRAKREKQQRWRWWFCVWPVRVGEHVVWMEWRQYRRFKGRLEWR